MAIDPNLLKYISEYYNQNQSSQQIPVEGNIQPSMDWLYNGTTPPLNPYEQPNQYNVPTGIADQPTTVPSFTFPENKPGVAPWAGETDSGNVDSQGRLTYSGETNNGIPSSIADGYTREQYIQMRNEAGFDPTTAGEEWDKANASNSAASGAKPFPFLSTTGSSLESELFMLGRALGQDPGTKGRGLAIAGGIGAATLGASRAGLSGFSYAKAQEEQQKWMREQLAKGRQGAYTPSPQYGNTNTLGGAMGKFGGLFNDGYFQDGGTAEQRYKEELEAYKNNPKNPQGVPMLGAEWQPISEAERKAKLAELESLDPADVNEQTMRDYYNLSQNKEFFISKDNPRMTLSPPIDITDKTVRGSLPPTYFAPPTTAPTVTNTEIPIEQNGYLIIDPESGQPRRVSSGEYNRFSGKKMTMPVDSRGNLVNPGTGGETFTNYVNFKQFQDGGQQQPQEGQQEQMQQIAMAAQQMLEQGMTPDDVISNLIQKGIPHQQAMQIVQSVMQPQMNFGGLFGNVNADPITNFNKNVGDMIEFEYGGMKKKGKIKKIENGKMYLY